MPSIRKLKQRAAVGIAHYGLLANPTDPAAVAAAKKAASPPMTETQLVTAIRQMLDYKRIPNVRVHSGVAHGVKGGFMHFANTGAPDILAFIPPNGRAVCIEVKVGKNPATANQLEWLKKAADAGAAAMIVRGINEATEKVETLLREAGE